jgi:hypothetical protein
MAVIHDSYVEEFEVRVLSSALSLARSLNRAFFLDHPIWFNRTLLHRFFPIGPYFAFETRDRRVPYIIGKLHYCEYVITGNGKNPYKFTEVELETLLKDVERAYEQALPTVTAGSPVMITSGELSGVTAQVEELRGDVTIVRTDLSGSSVIHAVATGLLEPIDGEKVEVRQRSPDKTGGPAGSDGFDFPADFDEVPQRRADLDTDVEIDSYLPAESRN